ncbi:hypothetical protein SBRCBS47491_002381 [Sporothrix bragantina]|uniref:NIPSNAP domain-containing protein n=1 Tax=Sporothrix bragantina TaxID=671064 RepID=A0ABP0B6D1_9PEZI
MLALRRVSVGGARFMTARALSSTTPSFAPNNSKTIPSLADIEPGRQDTFNSKQKEFRERLAEAQRAQETSASSSSSNSLFNTTRPVLPPEEEPGPPRLDSEGRPLQGLGSLSIGNKGSRAEASAKTPARKSGPISNLLYGTKEGRELDAQIEASFSQVLARGKYMHTILIHQVKPDKVAEYVELVGEWYPKMANLPENKVHLVGSWRTEVGDCDSFVHIWEYQRYEGYHASTHAVSNHPGYKDFEAKLRSLITSKTVSLMQEFSFWPTTPPRQLGGLFELRSYTLHPGNLLEWETHWRRGLKARREVMEGVGAWFVQVGELNTVHHLWQFADLEERKIRREQSWGIEGWSDTVHKTVPLIQSMKSRILVPMPWSPVA